MPEQAPKILGTGLVALDLVVSADPDSPVRSWAGGTCGNVLSILAWLGWDAYPIARLNDDAAAVRVKADFKRWGVHLDLADCGPAANTPIIVQQIKASSSGGSTHRFSWSCLRCGGWLPSFKPITRHVVDQVVPYIPETSVYFFDRVSRGALDLATQASEGGAVVMFEPSGRGDEKLFKEALGLAHIVKYADQRMADLAASDGSGNLRLEIQTLGSEGLRFRLPRNRRNPGWRTLNSAPAPDVRDSCGSGDWCTAGILSKLASRGVETLDAASVTSVTTALKFGQELAAWNCAFEGARGGMYAQSQAVAVRPDLFLPAASHAATQHVNNSPAADLVSCPRCEAA
ncbi:fructokinase [Branchiibius hedensis]|uniref:Fructokinase n=1 Tax=Branchiibius hedensis TaxID=672460 RepID=A0A2Y9BN67_9MICO|nr:fructokinase [Branchiibius hedensis]SSA58974.1 fructokinase [Branchiibius hedensis]